MPPDGSLAEADYCYLTTTGRRSGEPRTIEIWFALQGGTLYMLSGGRDGSRWVKNLLVRPEVDVRLDGQHFAGRARVVEDADEDALARRLLVEKYQPRYGGDLTNWGRSALPIAIDF
jgi:deazaflavin-dependent oxidoreductase (nitroreductase family)